MRGQDAPPRRPARSRPMDAKLQRRIQRYGWDLAADDYEALWNAQLAPARSAMLQLASLAPGEQVLDIACGTGLVTLPAARAVAPAGEAYGIDVSGRMVEAARCRAAEQEIANARFTRMDGEALPIPDSSFDAALCALGLMYMPDPRRAVREMMRVVRPGGRIVLAVWGERVRCGWSPLFGIVDDEVTSEVCPLFFQLGQESALSALCEGLGLELVRERRLSTRMIYRDATEACNAAFVGGPVALAWSRFDLSVRARVRERYVEAIEPWRNGHGYAIPGEFVVVSALTPPARH